MPRSGSRSAEARSSGAASCRPVSRRSWRPWPSRRGPYVPTSPELLDRGVRAVTSALRRDPGSPLAGVKTSSRADYVYARLEADRAGADDALLLTLDGHVSEASAANLFVLTGDRLTTPPLSAAILGGTTRTWLLNHAERLGLSASEVDLEPTDVLQADEAFLTGSVAGIVPVVALDGRPVGSGRPGPRGRALRAAREAWIDAMSMAALLPPEPDGPGS